MKKLQLVIVALWIMTIAVYISKTTRIPDVERNSEMERPGKRLDTLEEALGKITSDSSKSTVLYLSSQELEGRMSGKKGNDDAAVFIKGNLEKLGYQTRYQKFNIGIGHRTTNFRSSRFTALFAETRKSTPPY